MAIVSEKRSLDGSSHRSPHREQSRHQHEQLQQPPAQTPCRIMMFGDRLDQLRRVPLRAVLRETGAQRDRYDQAKWHTPKGAISITGMKFMNWHQGRGGGGAIDLAMHLNGLDFKRAIAWLQRHFPIPSESEPAPAARRLLLPPPDRSRLSTVKQYLVQDRAITPAMTDFLIASGKLYSDRRGNAVFL